MLQAKSQLMYHFFLDQHHSQGNQHLIVDPPNFLFYSPHIAMQKVVLQACRSSGRPSILPPNRWFAAPAFHAPSPTGSRIFGTPGNVRVQDQFQARGRAPWLGRKNTTRSLGCWLSRALISVPQKVATIWPSSG